MIRSMGNAEVDGSMLGLGPLRIGVSTLAQRFRPITLQRPAVLHPVLNVPLIEYTLEWLALNAVDEVIIFCCAHARKIVEYLEASKWKPDGDAMKVTPVVAQHQKSIGDALRFLDQANIIKSDFVLVSGDTVTNLKLAPILAEHNERRQKDKNAILTMVTQPGIGSTQRRRLGENDSVCVLDPETSRLLSYAEKTRKNLTSCIDATLFGERDTVQVRTDLMITQIYICAPEVLMLFSDNFDYQNIRRDFLNGVLSEEELGNKIHIYETPGEYAIRVQSLRSYDSVSRDLLKRWVYPFAPDTGVLSRIEQNPTGYRYGCGNQYIETSVRKGAYTDVGHDTCIGRNTVIGRQCKIVESVIGVNCRIDDGVEIIGSYIEDNVHVCKGARVYQSLICEGCVIHKEARLSKGVLLSFDVVISPHHKVPEYTRVTMCPQPEQQEYDSDDELEYSPTAHAAAIHVQDLEEFEVPSSPIMRAANMLKHMTQSGLGMQTLPRPPYFDDSLVGAHGAGRGWVQPYLLDEQFLSIASPPVGGESSSEDELSDISEGSSDVDETDIPHADVVFEREVAETFLRCVKMHFDRDNIKLELNGLKIAEVRTFADCARYIFTTLLFLCMPPMPHVKPEYRNLFPAEAKDMRSTAGQTAFLKIFEKLIKEWAPLMSQFLRDEDDQVELMFTFEEFYKGEGAFAIEDHWGSSLGPIVPRICQILYDEDVVDEDAFLAWAREKEGAEDEEDLEMLNKAQGFITWLTEAEEEDSDKEDEDEDEDEEDEAD